MLEKPALPDEDIITCLRNAYGISATALEFLQIGNDSSAWVYQVQTGEKDYFLKVKKGAISAASLTVPRFLKTSHIEQVVAPLPTQDQNLSQSLGDFTLILYPFIEGRSGMEKGLSDAQWIEMGTTLRKIHSITVPSTLHVPREMFVPAWGAMTRRLHRDILSREYEERFERELASFWRSRQNEIKRIIDHTDALGQQLLTQPLEFVLCHCDIHTANVLIDLQERLHIVDWDMPLLAPKERDLMFAPGHDEAGGNLEALFYTGYGKTDINPTVIAYYRYEWVVQELGDFSERVFYMQDVGVDTKQDAVEGIIKLFEPGNVIDAAYESSR